MSDQLPHIKQSAMAVTQAAYTTAQAAPEDDQTTVAVASVVMALGAMLQATASPAPKYAMSLICEITNLLADELYVFFKKHGFSEEDIRFAMQSGLNKSRFQKPTTNEVGHG